MLLKHCLDQGLTKAELARRFGVDRRTIHNWIASGQLERDEAAGEVRYKPRPPVAHKLDPYKGIIESRLEERPKLSAQRLFDEIVKAGYDGGYSQVAMRRISGCFVRWHATGHAAFCKGPSQHAEWVAFWLALWRRASGG